VSYLAEIESFLDRAARGDVGEEEVLRAAKLLGIQTRRVDVVVKRWGEVLGRHIEKRCVDVGDDARECIYGPVIGEPPRYFPAMLHANGSVLLFRRGKITVVSFPTPRTIDLGGHGVKPPSGPAQEVTKRVDGWQISLYYDPVLGRWIGATRYVLHNMRFSRGLIVEDFGNVVNPFVDTALTVAEATGILDRVRGFEGWTFTFVLVGPEPATARPGQPSKWAWEKYRLVLVNARRPDHTLLTVAQSGELLKLETVPILDQSDVESLAQRFSRDPDTQSVFARFGDDPVTPTTIEVKSLLYPEAVELKYRANPKSLVVLASEGVDVGRYLPEAYSDYAWIADCVREAIEAAEKNPDAATRLTGEKNPRRGVKMMLAEAAQKGWDVLASTCRELLNKLRGGEPG